MMYLMGGGLKELSRVVEYTIANVGGIICDGAKSSCAAKIASAVEAALLAIRLIQKNRGFGKRGRRGKRYGGRNGGRRLGHCP